MPPFDVTIAGELNLDLILYGVPPELPPEREMLVEGMMLTLGSSSAIVAHNLSALGCRVGFVSRIGDDPLGQIALQRLEAAGVDVSQVRVSTGATKTGLTAILQREGWRNMVTYLGTIAELRWEDLDLKYLAGSRHFHLSSFYLQRGLQSHVPELFRRLKAAGLTISLDTNDDPDDRWQGGLKDALKYVDVFMPNANEARKISGTDDLERALSNLAQIVPLVVVKRGKEGAVARRGAERVACHAVKLDAVDSVGAGDSFNAGFLSQYVRGADLATCMGFGCLAGSFSTTQAGGTEAFRDLSRREEFFRKHAAANAPA